MRILVAGLGSIGKRHLRVCRQCFPEAELFAVSSRGIADAADQCADYSLLQNIDEALALGLSFAIVATPASNHQHFVNLLNASGVPVLIEKPLAASSQVCRELVDGLNSSVKTGVAYQFRFSPSVQKLKSQLESGLIGQLLHVQMVTGQYLPDWRPDKDYRDSVSARKELGGGVIRELSHELDLLLWLLGRPDQLCASVNNSGSLDIDCEDQMDALFKLQDGTVINLHLDMLQQQPQRYWLLTGTMGSIRMDLIQQQILYTSSVEQKDERISLEIERDHLFQKQLQAFANYALGDADWNGASLEEGTAVLELVEALESAAQQRKWLDFNEC